MAKRYDVELEKKIVEEYENGMTPYQMVKLIPELKGKRPSVIYGILKRLNVQVRNPIVITDEQKLNRRKYSVNDNYFNVIDTEEKVWRIYFSNKLNRLLARSNMTQRDLSRLTDISEVTLSKYARGLATPSAFNIRKIAKAFGVNPTELMDI